MKCFHCKQKYDNIMEVCPYCGFPKSKSENKYFLNKLKIILILVIIVVVWIFSNKLYQDTINTKLDYEKGYYLVNGTTYYTDGMNWYSYSEQTTLWTRENTSNLDFLDNYLNYVDNSEHTEEPPSSVPSLWDNIQMFRWN